MDSRPLCGQWVEFSETVTENLGSGGQEGGGVEGGGGDTWGEFGPGIGSKVSKA